MNSNFNISGSIKNLSLNVTGFRVFFKTEETLDTLGRKAHTIEQIMTEQLNRILVSGVKLPIQDNGWGDNMQNSSLVHFDNYLFGDSEPDILNSLRLPNALQQNDGAMDHNIFIEKLIQ